MVHEFENRLSRLLGGLVAEVRRRAAVVVGISLLAAAGSLLYAAGNLGVNSDITALISEDVPFVKVRRDFERAFPLLENLLVVVVDAESPERAARAVDLLGARFAAQRELFHGVFVPGGGPFFARQAFLYLDVEQLKDVGSHLAEARPYLAEMSRDPSLRGLFMLIGRVLQATRTGQIGGLDPAPFLDRVSEALEASLDRGRHATFSWAEIMLGEAARTEKNRRVVILSPVLDMRQIQPARGAVESVRRVVAETGLADDSRVRVRLTGDFALAYEEMEVVKGQAAVAGILSFVAVAVLLVLALRSGWMILAILATLLVGLACSLGFAAAAVGHLNPISVAFAVLFIGLSVDFGIHMCLRYQELRNSGQPHGPALVETGRQIGTSLVLCALTTVVGFYAFVPTDFRGVAELGLIAGTGIALSLVFSLTLLPAILELAPARVREAMGRKRLVALPDIGRLPARHPRAVRIGAAAAALGALVLVPGAHFDHNPLSVRDPGTESVQALEDLLDASDASPWSISILAPDLASAEALAGRLERLDVVSQAITPGDFVPGGQREKIEIIRRLSLFLGPGVNRGRLPAPTRSQDVAAMAESRRELRAFLEARAGDGPLERSARRLDAAVAAVERRLDDPAAREPQLRELEKALIEPMRWRLDALREALQARPVALEDLPRSLLDLAVGSDGRVRVEVMPAKDLNDRAALAEFVDKVREQAPNATGLPVNYVESARAIVRSFQEALGFAAVAIALLLLALWRRVGDTVVVMAILGLGALVTVGFAVLAGIPFNFADVIVLPLLLGIGVDSSIHLVHRFRGEGADRVRLLRSSTARAVWFSALTTIASFGSLGLATHRGMATMGQLLTIGVVVMLVCNLIVLPALLPARRARNN